MANREHVEVVRRGADALLDWRARNSDAVLDLRAADLRGLDLKEARLAGADLSSADLTGSDLTEAQLREAKLLFATLVRADITGADLWHADLAHAQLRGAVLATAILDRAVLEDAVLDGADLLRAQARDADLSRASLRRADLSEANLSGATLADADLHRANMAGADVSYTKLESVTLSRANLSNANLLQTDFTGAILGFTAFDGCDLSASVKLESAEHRFPSSVDHIALARTLRGRDGVFSPEERTFFLAAGVPAALLDAFPRMVQDRPLDFTSVYVIAAQEDSWEAQRLRHDLAAQGIVLWRYDEETLVGRGRGAGVERTQPVYDKLVVLCSKSGLEDTALLQETERAFYKEERLRRQRASDSRVIIPVTLDGHLETDWEHPRAQDIMGKRPVAMQDGTQREKQVQELVARLRD